ncbi:MAG TPA: DUF6374 family protein [Kofleriaceae bacterium]|nr:DUF6374 family protein [Kofleriaceae bacterium]
MSDDPTWKPLDPAGLKARLAQVRALLIQAAAVGMTQDAEQLDKLAELERRIREPPNATPRRYR